MVAALQQFEDFSPKLGRNRVFSPTPKRQKPTHGAKPKLAAPLGRTSKGRFVAGPGRIFQTLRVLPPSLDPCSGDGTGDGAQPRGGGGGNRWLRMARLARAARAGAPASRRGPREPFAPSAAAGSRQRRCVPLLVPSPKHGSRDGGSTRSVSNSSFFCYLL